jgi:5'-3' exonuclease
MDKILLIDGHNALHRANTTFTFKKHTNQVADEFKCECGGEWIDGKCSEEPNPEFIPIYNFFRNLRPIIELFAPEKCFFVLEGHPQFRFDLFAGYKASRFVKYASKKEELNKFFKYKDRVVDLLKYLPITICRAEKYECDDVIGALSENLKDEDLVILSNDSDFIQILQRGYKHCRIYNPIKKTFMEPPAYHYIGWKSLNGDKSDDIPSLLTPKKALDAISSPEKLKKFLSLEENRANFNINRQLIEFLPVPEEDIEFREGQSEFDKLKEEFVQMKFETITNDKSWERYKNTFNCIKY